MNRKYTCFGKLAVGLGLLSLAAATKYSTIVSSARTFEHCFREMDATSAPLGPVERIAYSLILATDRK